MSVDWEKISFDEDTGDEGNVKEGIMRSDCSSCEDKTQWYGRYIMNNEELEEYRKQPIMLYTKVDFKCVETDIPIKTPLKDIEDESLYEMDYVFAFVCKVLPPGKEFQDILSEHYVDCVEIISERRTASIEERSLYYEKYRDNSIFFYGTWGYEIKRLYEELLVSKKNSSLGKFYV